MACQSIDAALSLAFEYPSPRMPLIMAGFKTQYDVVVVGGGHNGLVSACYLAKAGLSVLVLEGNAEIGGATQSKRIFPGMDARLSAYSYLVSLFPQKIIDDLGLGLRLKTRKTASWTPSLETGTFRELLLRNGDPEFNRAAFIELAGNEEDYRGYLELQNMQEQLASVIWPSLTSPLTSRKQLRSRLNRKGEEAWQAFIEEPLGDTIERLISDDLIRGNVFTDGRIGVSTFPHDPTLVQNRCFLYHVIGQGTGEWKVPEGGMGALVENLVAVSQETGRVRFATRAKALRIDPGIKRSSISFDQDGGSHEVDARFILCNASRQVLGELLDESNADEPVIEGAGFKMNLLLKRLPKLRSKRFDASEAFAGTLHIDEGYEQMMTSYRESNSGKVPAEPPGEIYCHTLTDTSILSDELVEQGYHTLTLFGLDLPYSLFEKDNEKVRAEASAKYLAGINQYLDEPIEACLATDANGSPCIEAMSALDLENKLRLPKGNIFHGDLTWPFADSEEDVGQWGVETEYSNILICGSAAKRGGAVSGIPGHNAAMKVLDMANSMKS